MIVRFRLQITANISGHLLSRGLYRCLFVCRGLVRSVFVLVAARNLPRHSSTEQRLVSFTLLCWFGLQRAIQERSQRHLRPPEQVIKRMGRGRSSQLRGCVGLLGARGIGAAYDVRTFEPEPCSAVPGFLLDVSLCHQCLFVAAGFINACLVLVCSLLIVAISRCRS